MKVLEPELPIFVVFFLYPGLWNWRIFPPKFYFKKVKCHSNSPSQELSSTYCVPGPLQSRHIVSSHLCNSPRRPPYSMSISPNRCDDEVETSEVIYPGAHSHKGNSGSWAPEKEFLPSQYSCRLVTVNFPCSDRCLFLPHSSLSLFSINKHTLYMHIYACL